MDRYGGNPKVWSTSISVFMKILEVWDMVAFHLSVNGQKSVRARVMGRSRPNFGPKLEPIHRTRDMVDIWRVRNPINGGTHEEGKILLYRVELITG